MEKFLEICSQLKNNSKLNHKKVNAWFNYLMWNTDKNRYYSIDLIRVPKQEYPAMLLDIKF